MILVLPIKYSEKCTAKHELFIKQHSVRGESIQKPKGRTLFVLNVPPWLTKNAIKTEFSKFGPVLKVIIQTTPSNDDLIEPDPQKTGFKVAYIVFQKPVHVIKALNSNTIIITNSLETIGVKKWLNEYQESIINRDQTEKEIEAFMANYDQQLQTEKESPNEPDDDGWITVTKKSRNPGIARKESVTNKIRMRSENSKKKKELLNFYTFQIRESKMKHLASLRQKFDEDKKKIENMKNNRRFKPF